MLRAFSRPMWGLVSLVAAVSLASLWWRGHVASGLARDIGQLARPGDILMLSSQTCTFCQRAREWLNRRQVPFAECFIETDAACAQRYQALGAQGTPTLLVRGQPQLGFSPQQLRDRLVATATP